MIYQNQTNVISTVGKRKSSIAKIFLKEGETQITVNNKTLNIFLLGFIDKAKKILELVKSLRNYTITILVKGGGIVGQLDAIILAFARLISKIKPAFKIILKKKKLLTRDSRIKERRKYGLKKARKTPQYSKR